MKNGQTDHPFNPNADDAQNLMPGRQQKLVTMISSTVDASAFQRVDVPRGCVLMPADPADARLVRYYSGTPNDLTLPNGLAYNAFDGICYLTKPGVWWVNVPHSASGVVLNFVLKDVQSAVLAQAIATGTSTPDAVPSITAAAPGVNTDVDTASESLVAADATRKWLYIRNTSATQIISLGFGANAAVAGSGITLGPGEWICLLQEDGVKEAVNVISNANNATVAFQTKG